MTTATTTQIPVPYGAVTAPLRRFTVEEYQQLIRQGFFRADDRFELLEGLIVEKMPRDPIHDAALEMADDLIRALLPPGWRVRVQSAIVTGDSQPEPDLVVVRGHPSSRVAQHPGPNDLALVVGISNTTLAEDRGWKSRLYARAGVQTYWIINLPDSRVEVYTDPSGPDPAPAFRRRNEFGIGRSVPLLIEGTERGPLAVQNLIPQQETGA